MIPRLAFGYAYEDKGVAALRRAEYEFAVDVALPVILYARAAGNTTGEHLASFLNKVGVRAPKGDVWTKNSANRAVANLVKRGLLKWSRHRGKRNPTLEAKRIKSFSTAWRACRKQFPNFDY